MFLKQILNLNYCSRLELYICQFTVVLYEVLDNGVQF